MTRAEPKFEPEDGQVDYSNIRYAPVINTVVTNSSKILLVQRSPKLRLYPGYWNGVSGFLDDSRSVEEKVKDELKEELGLKESDILDIKQGRVLLQEAPKYKKTWLVVPILAKVRTTKFQLDWEAASAHWFTLVQARDLKLLPGFDAVLDEFFGR